MLKRVIISSITLVISLFFSLAVAEENHDHDDHHHRDENHLHENDIQPWRIGAEIFVNSNLFETDFGDLRGGPYATNNPGVDINVAKGAFTPGNWLRFQPVGRLHFWNGSEWIPHVPDGERIEVIDARGNIIEFGADDVSDIPAIIGQIDSSGGLHEHIDFSILNASNAQGGSTGAYRIQLRLFESQPNSDVSVSIATSPIAIVFNRGLEHEGFEKAASAAADLDENSVLADNGILNIQRVKAFGKYYKAKLNFIGNNQFQLIAAEEIPETEHNR
ncbi:hypothetical protein [Nitrosomonas sp. ANs5]|uniref:hypothetical protein n=1 Tax=Nitrosomonas sp. ANs5 TaxID=3423941 RepID=UPI003D33F7A2